MAASIDGWDYRGEGNANLVIAHRQDRKVLRLLKVIKADIETSEVEDKSRQYDNMDQPYSDLRTGLNYVNHVILPLIGADFVQAGEIVAISKEFIRAINSKVRPHRPGARLHKDADEDIPCALQMADFCVPFPIRNHARPCICIEIKPKQGFITTSSFASSSVKRQVCRYYMDQVYKLNCGKIKQLSGYCPLDLFSGNVKQMTRSLQALFNHPQNNLRVFKDGVQIWVDKKSEELSCNNLSGFVTSPLTATYSRFKNGTEDLSIGNAVTWLCDLIIQALLKKQTCVAKITQLVSRYEEFCPCHGHFRKAPEFQEGCLPVGSILDCLLRMQSLDSLDIEGIYPLYEQLQKHFTDHPQDRISWCLDGPYDTDQWSSHDLKNEGTHGLLYAVQKIKQFLLSKTFKDCSIMLSLQQIPLEETCKYEGELLEDIHGHKYNFYVSIIDLDPKPFDRIEKYIKQDKTLVLNYMNFLKQNQKNDHQKD